MAGYHKWTPQDDEDLLHLADAGFLLETVAEVLGRSSGAARRRLTELRASASAPVPLTSPGEPVGP